jgi:hypothetical protein
MGVWQFVKRWFDSPDLTSIFADCTIAWEFSTACDVVDRHLQPFGLIL